MENVHKSRKDFDNTEDPIQALWNKRGEENTEDLPDQVQKELENLKLFDFIDSSHDVLDVGCGNGLTPHRIAERAKSIHGQEYAPVLLEKARQNTADNLTFSQGDVRKMEFEDASFDRVYSQRVLINLNSREEQLLAMKEVHRVLRLGGVFLMLETSKEGMESISKYRKSVGLSEINPPWHNLPIDESWVIKNAMDFFDLKDTVHFGTYFFLTRLINPLLAAPEQPSYNSKLNQIAQEVALKIPEITEEMSQIKIFVLEKK